MSERKRTHCFAAVVVMAVLVSAAPLEAAPIAYEGFDYANGTNLRTQTGGSGWSTAWTNTGDATETATTPGLTYSTLSVAGNKATLAGEQDAAASGSNVFLFRSLSSGVGADGTTVWLSFIGQRTGTKAGTTPNYQRFFGISLFNAGTATANEMASIGELSNDTNDMWALNPIGTGTSATNRTAAAIDSQSFLLVKIQYLTGNDSVSLWVNPNLSLGEAGLGTAHATMSDSVPFDRLRLSAGGSQTTTGTPLAASGLIDEIRMGTTFGDVVPVPEPAGLALLVFVGLALRRRRTA